MATIKRTLIPRSNPHSSEWLIPHIAPRHHGLVTVFAPALPRDYDPEVEFQLYEAGYFAGRLENLYRHHRERLFVVPWTWLKREHLQDHAATIMSIAESCPTLVCATADMPHVATRFLSGSRAGLVIGHQPTIATVICGDEPGWTVSLCPGLDPTIWTLAHPFDLNERGVHVVEPGPKKPPTLPGANHGHW